MSKNFSIECWQGILRGQAMPGDIMGGESIAVYVHRRFGTLVAEIDALQGLLNQRDAQIDNIVCQFPQMCSSACACKTNALPADGTDYDHRTDLRAYFGLSYASWLTLPRVLMEAMPEDWQRRAATLLHEYDDAYQNPPQYGTTVRLTVDGKLVKTPMWMNNYRHPDREMINQVRGKAAQP